MACKDIIIDIQNYDATNTYTVMVKRSDNIITDGSIIPSYTQTATSRQVIFKSLPDGEYVACVQRTCATGGTSDSVCKDVVGHNCAPPLGVGTSGLTDTTAQIDWTDEPGFSFGVYIDKGPKLVPTAPGQYAATGLTPNSVYEGAVKKECKVSEFSAPANVHFQTNDTATPAFTVRVVRKLCTGTTFDGYLLRFAITGGLAGVGDIYTIEFTDFEGDVHTMGEYTVGVSDTVTTMIKKIANALGGSNLLISTGVYGSFDIISREQKTENGVILACQDLDEVTGYATSIV